MVGFRWLGRPVTWWPRGWDAVADAGLAVIAGTECALNTREWSWNTGHSMEPVFVAGSFLLGFLLVFRRKFPVPVVMIGVFIAYFEAGTWLFHMVALYSVGVHCRSRRMAVAALAVALQPGMLPWYPGPGFTFIYGGLDPRAFAWSVAWSLPPSLLGLYVRTYRELLASLRVREEQGDRERWLLAERTRAEERTRLAREMHDVVAHQVSLIAIHAGAAEAVAWKDPEAAVRSVRMVGDTARQALDELRGILRVLRLSSCVPGTPGTPGDGDGSILRPEPFLVDLAQLVEWSRAAGLPVTVRHEGTACPLGPDLEETVYSLVREALTNVHKHAGPVGVEVTLQYGEAAFEVRVENAAPVSPPVVRLPGSGLGLIGMRERVTALGGAFHAGSTAAGGFRAAANLPLPATTAALSQVPVEGRPA